jgi:ribosomal protein S18 acetylase RimI-like enzyme
MIKFMEFQTTDTVGVIALWEVCNLTRPWNDPVKDINFVMANPNSTILVGRMDSQIVASAMVGHDGHRGVFYYFAVNPDFQKQGIGAALMQAGETWLKARGVWKINILVRDDNLDAVGFYRSLGFEQNAVVSMGKLIS